MPDANLVSPGPHPLRQFIVKVHGRCDLACDYCYVFTMADQRWRSRPRVISHQVLDQTAVRIAEHRATHGIGNVDVVLHGGEPLLAGPAVLSYGISALRAAVGADLRVVVQTNGVRLDRRFLDLFAALDVQVAVSLDGDADAHDRHRRRPNGTGSYHEVAPRLRRLGREPYRALFSGLLCTIDLHNEPVATYEALLDFAPPRLDFLLPHGNWSSPPPGRDPASPRTPYGDWLIAVFDRWYDAPRHETSVRLFEELMSLLLGGQSRVEGIGTGPAVIAVVETNGDIEQSDMLASAYDGAAATGLNVADDPFDAMLRLPAFRRQQDAAAALSATCRACSLRRVCGGGLYAHRYRATNAFDNPSVYCPDLTRLIRHVQQRLETDLASLRRATP